MSNYKTVFFTLGVLQIILGLSMIVPILAQFFYDQMDSGFVSSGVITIIFGVLFFLSNLDHNKKLSLPQAFLLTALSWLSIAIFGSLPFVFSNIELSLTDAFFESMSGITTTGSTILTNLNETPKAILLWRAMLQWLGGIGIIVMAITLMPIMNIGGMQLFVISTSNTPEKILPKSKEVSVRLILVYIALTITCAVFYKIFGMGFFDSIVHSMTTIATGGFSNYNESIGYFDSALIETTSMIFIILGSIPFIAYLKFLNGDKKIFLNDTQIKTFFKIIIFSVLLMFIYLSIINQSVFQFNFREVAFNVISILTGTGYVTQNFSEWGSFPLMYFLILMFIGGCAGSTACGIKIFRLQMLVLFLVNQIKKLFYPNSINIVKYNKQKITDEFLNSVIIFIFAFLFIFLIISLLLSLTGLDLLTSLSGAASAISNVGPGLGGIIGPNGNFSQLPDFSKWILTIGMILGRLELFAIIVLFIPSFWRRY